MDDLNRYIAENNAANFFSQLASETDVAKRATLSRLLLDEENKFAREAQFLDKVDSYIARCDAQISKHHALLEGNHFPESMRALAEKVLGNMNAIKTILHAMKKRATENLNKANGP